jgi:hypothetical protein
MEHAGVLDSDRCGWDDADMAVQVTEHLRPLDPRAVSDLRHNRIDKLVKRADGMLSHAPFTRTIPHGRNPSDAKLRRYAGSFGLHVPPRLEPDRERTTAMLVETLRDLARHKKKRYRVSIVHVLAPPPPEGVAEEELKKAVRKLKSRGIEVRWTTPPVATPLDFVEPPPEGVAEPVASPKDELTDRLPIVERVVVMRAALANRRGESRLRRAGVKVLRSQRSPAKRRPLGAGDGERVA